MATLAKTHDISIVVTAHHERELSHRTLRSVWQSVRHAEGYGLSCEVLVVLDRPDAATRDYFMKHQPDVRLLEVDYGDTGPARNHGAREARGRYVSFIDGDDLYCEQWLYRAYRQAEACAGMDAVFHAEYMVFFESEHLIRRHISTLQPEFSVLNLLEYWHWSAVNLLERDLALRYPFHECPSNSGFGFEDWHWFCELIAAGAEIIPVEQTCLFYRKRQNSRCSEHNGTVIPPSRLFDLDVLRRRVAQDARQRSRNAPAPTSSFPSPQTAPAPSGLLTRALQTPLRHWPWKIARRCLPPAIRRCMKAAARCLPKGLLAAVRAKLLPPIAFRVGPSPASLPTQFPRWLLEEWRSMHALEPQLYPDRRTLDAMQWTSHIPESKWGAAYLKLAEQIDAPISHVLLTPWLKTGGADRTVINYAKALDDAKLADRVLVIATESTDSPWARRLPPSVQFLDFGRQCAHLDARQQELLLLRLLLQKHPQVIHNLNSLLGYNVYVKHANALAERSRLYAHTFCDNIEPEGQAAGYNRFYLPKCIEHLTAVISDNQTELNRLAEIFAFDPAKLFAHYQPVDLAPLKRRPIRDRLDVLWAGRLDRQKRPDILEAIARRCRDLPICFHAYGATVIEGARVAPPTGPNIRFHGPFDGFSSLPLEQFDAFLYTSQWDGLPNILSEAGASGLPVIASDVGGVAELIHHGETGFLASPYDNPEPYRSALLNLLTGRVDPEQLNRRMLQALAERHSWEAFIARLRTIPGYVASEGEGMVRQTLTDDRGRRAA
jgi:glycosyltransferase involved in cell wall biosynthesis